MLTIALTGGIGSGKSIVCDYFITLAEQSDDVSSLHIIDADSIARQLLSGSLQEAKHSKHLTPKQTALKNTHKLFGDDIFHPSGKLNRTVLRSLIFSSKTKKQQLEQILHPLIHREITQQLAEIKSSSGSNSINIIAIPLLFETSQNYPFDRILVIDTPINTQIERSSKRDKCSTKLIKKIIESQVSRKIRLAHANDIIDNSGSLEQLKRQVVSLFQYYCSLLKQSKT